MGRTLLDAVEEDQDQILTTFTQPSYRSLEEWQEDSK